MIFFNDLIIKNSKKTIVTTTSTAKPAHDVKETLFGCCFDVKLL